MKIMAKVVCGDEDRASMVFDSACESLRFLRNEAEALAQSEQGKKQMELSLAFIHDENTYERFFRTSVKEALAHPYLVHDGVDRLVHETKEDIMALLRVDNMRPANEE